MSHVELTRILYVEDEPDIQAVAKLALETLGGFILEICNNGQQAIDKGPGFVPQLVLMDVMMPGMDGPSTLNAIRKIATLATVPVIFMTAKVQPQEVAELRAAGAIEVIAKPFDPMSLSQTIRTIWLNHQGKLSATG